MVILGQLELDLQNLGIIYNKLEIESQKDTCKNMTAPKKKKKQSLSLTFEISENIGIEEQIKLHHQEERAVWKTA